METQTTESDFDAANATGQRKRNRQTSQKNCQLLRLAPLICVITGCILTVVGHIASLKSCEIAGPVLMTTSGLILLFLTFWNSRKDRLTENTAVCEEGVTDTREQNLDQTLSEEDTNFQLGPIHHFKVWIPSEPFAIGHEMVPPSYEEAVSCNNTENQLQTISVVAPGCDT